MGKKHYDWNEIQKSYDDGNSTRDLTKIFGVSHGSFQKARNRGDFNSYRTIKEAMVIARKKYPDSFKLSDITKKKISDFRIQYYKENPEMHPNRLLANNRNKWTYPERLAAEWFEKQKNELQAEGGGAAALNLARVLELVGDKQKACEQYKEFLEKNPLSGQKQFAMIKSDSLCPKKGK